MGKKHHHHHHHYHRNPTDGMNDEMVMGHRSSKESGHNIIIPVVAIILGVLLLVLVGMSFTSCNTTGSGNLSDKTIESIKDDASKKKKEQAKEVRFDSESAPWFYIDNRNRIYFDADAHEKYYSSKDYTGDFSARETLKIPTYFDNIKVSVINGETFGEENSYIKKVIISDGVQAVGNGAFKGFKSLRSVTIPSSVTRVMGEAFHDTPWYRAQEAKFVTVGDGVLIKYNGIDSDLAIPKNVKAIDCMAFSNLESAEAVYIPASVTYIGDAAFKGCTAEEIEIPQSVTSIANDAFFDSAYLKKYKGKELIVGKGCMISYAIENSVIRIPNEAFQLSGLDFEEKGKGISLHIGENVNAISDFEALGYFNEFKVDIDNPYLSTDSGVLYSKDKTIVYRFPVFSDETRYELHPLTTRISSEAFSASHLEYIQLSNKLVQIDDRAFSGCKELKELRMPDTTTILGTSLFRDCQKLKRCELSDKISVIPHGIFSGCESLEELYIPDTVREIKGNSFWGCKSLKKLVIHERLTKINLKTFKDCNISFEVDDRNPVYASVDGKLTEIPKKEESINDAGTVSGVKNSSESKTTVKK